MRARIARILILGLCLVAPAAAWWDSGHELVAQIAEERILPQTQSEVTRILRHHPDPLVRDLVAASAWPDVIKSKKHPFHSYEHSNWHYQNRAIEPVEGYEDNGEMLLRLKESMATLEDREQPLSDRAVALCWVAHLVGDIHQPLHNSNSFRSEFLPNGDEGGNRFKVWLGSNKISLHNLWDSVGGRFLRKPSRSTMISYRVWFQHLYPPKAFLEELNAQDPSAWSDEGLQIARLAYADLEPGAELSDESYQLVLRTTERQIPLAGYRLASLLDRAFGDVGTQVVDRPGQGR